jgi:hypothetical protein
VRLFLFLNLAQIESVAFLVCVQEAPANLEKQERNPGTVNYKFQKTAYIFELPVKEEDKQAKKKPKRSFVRQC